MARAFAALIGQQLKTSAGKADSRKKLIGAVRAASARMGLDDADRKAIQLEVAGKASMADMNLAEIGKVLDRLNRDRPAASVTTRPHIAKIKALWWTLYWLGELGEPNDAALDAFVARQTGIASLRFLDHRHAPSVIEALKSMAVRAGVKWPAASTLAAVRAGSNPAADWPHLERHAVLDAIWTRLRDRKLVRAITHHEFVQRSLGLSLNHWNWSARELDEAIKLLGKKLRQDMAKQARAEAADR